jgi:uncharacterized protein (DUF697 family)
MFDKIKHLFSTEQRDAQLHKRLGELRQQTPVPVFWLYGKTQSGKTSIIKYLTGAEDAEIGQGFRPTTRYSRLYQFPTPEAPLLTFIDTRGVDEPGYDPGEDLARFNDAAHVVVITVKVLDHALENLLEHFRPIRAARRDRPVVLCLTTLHEAYPQQQHPLPHEQINWWAREHREAGDGPPPAGNGREGGNGKHHGDGRGGDGPVPGAGRPHAATLPPEALRRSIEEQCRRFGGLYDYLVPLDLTRPEEGFHDPEYGGPYLKETLLHCLPAAHRQTLLTLDKATSALRDLYAEHALPHILAFASLAATAGAIPVPWVDLLIVPGIQTRMIYHLAEYYGQPLRAERFLELAGTLGLGVVMRQAVRELIKFVPYVGSVVGAAVAGASTFALGKAFCYYYSAVHQGHVPRPEQLRHYYQEQLALAEKLWRKGGKG